MTDQMPDEVWVDEHDVAWNAGDGLIPGDAVRYIRADLYEQAEAERDEWKSRFAALEVNWLKDTEQCEQAEAARDRLRAMVSEAKRRIGIYIDDECSYDETLEMGRFVLDAFHGIQEALDHD